MIFTPTRRLVKNLFDAVGLEIRRKQSGFVAYDIFGFQYRLLDGALNQFDMIFVREDGFFRQSHAYATPEQRQVQDREFNANLAKMRKELS
jgi:hypothetical protein